MSFTAEYKQIIKLLENINPIQYGKTRNYINGSVTRLSPYISRGVISTKQVYNYLLEKGYPSREMGKLIQELAWRDYWQQAWKVKGDEINQDLRRIQTPVSHHEMPSAILNAETGIEAVDVSINELYKTGYMHNHLRMYTASLACNMAYSAWLAPAQWMYYYLLDADWASNALSWQWVAGSNANKKYVANQENVNNYCFTNQTGTFLDVPYESMTFPSYEANPEIASTPTSEDFKMPSVLLNSKSLELTTNLPEKTEVLIDTDLPTCIYNWYNLDPKWLENEKTNRVLLLEPSVFKKYPISDKSVQFMLDLSKNIEGIQIFTGEFSQLKQICSSSEIHYKEHPLNNYQGTEHSRDWMFNVEGYFKSFFAFWKKCKKELPSIEA